MFLARFLTTDGHYSQYLVSSRIAHTGSSAGNSQISA